MVRSGARRSTLGRFRGDTARLHRLGLPAGALLAILLALPNLAAAAASPGTTSPAIIHRPLQQNFTAATVPYNSSVDGFPLSYSEVLPLNFSSSQTYPLAIELHGIAATDSTPMRGGYPTPITNETADAAVAAGFIEIVINTRTGDGYYVDSKYDGPQAQDVLDAISHEQALRHIGKLYLFGFSMGAMGALSIGLNHPGLFAGLGAVAAFSDDFELEDRVTSLGNTVLSADGLLPTGGQWPNASSYAEGIFLELSALRFHPQNSSGTRMWIAAGGNDVFGTNNPALWPYEQANATVLDSTCLVVTSYGEPANCTLPLAVLQAEDPANYSYRYVYEPNGPHDYALLNATDMFAYFEGAAPSGAYWGAFPYPTLLPPPVPLVTLATEPTGCGAFSLNATVYPSEQSVPVRSGLIPFAVAPCSGTMVESVATAGGVSYDSVAGTLDVTGSGSVVARLGTPSYAVSIFSDSVCRSILFAGAPETANTTVDEPAGSYSATALPCAGYRFVGWTASGLVSVSNRTNLTVVVTVAGAGTLGVEFAAIPPPPPQVAVTLIASPGSCGPIQFAGISTISGGSEVVRLGSYNLTAPSCPEYSFVVWSVSGGVAVTSDSAATTAVISAAGTATAIYASLASGSVAVEVVVSPSSCGPAVRIGTTYYANGSTAYLLPGAYNLTALPCAGYLFQAWSVSGGVMEFGGALQVATNGSVQAAFSAVSSGGGTGGDGPASPSSVNPGIWLATGVVVGAVAAGVAVWLLVRRRDRPRA